MDLSDLVTICKAWYHMGWAVQEQLEAVLKGEPLEDQNPNALEKVLDFIREVDRVVAFLDADDLRNQLVELKARIDDHLAANRDW